MSFVFDQLKRWPTLSHSVPERVQRHCPHLRSLVLCVAVWVSLGASFSLPLPAQAAVLGDANVRSYLGQKLDAEIEISALTAAEAEALLVRIPAADAFASAGIDMTALVRSLRVTLDKRGDQTFARINSDQPVNDPFLMVLVELNAGGTRTLRQYALLIDPAPLDRAPPTTVEPAITEPQSAAADAPAPGAGEAGPPSAVADASTSTSAPKQASGNSKLVATTSRRVRKGDTLVVIGKDVQPDGVRLEQVLVALQRANPQAFAGNNINRMKSGSVLSVPAADSMRDIDANAARRIVMAQSADFNRYREALAERMNIPAAPPGNAGAEPAAGNRSRSGTVGVQVREPGARPEPQDQLKLTAPAAARNGAAANGTNDRKALDQVASDKALADANSRIAALEKNLTQMEQMLEVRDRKLADAQRSAELAAKEAKQAQVASTPAPSTSPANAAPAAPASPGAASPSSAQDNKPVTGAAPSPSAANAAMDQPAATVSARAMRDKPARQDLWTDVLSEPLPRALAAGAALLALLALLGRRLRARRQGAGKAGRGGKRSKVNLVGSATAQTPIAEAAPAAGTADTADTAAPQAEPAVAPVLAAVKGDAKGAGKAGDVDAIAEADVYIAYGRDEQAEEILRDALREQPQRHALRVKLLEIYASRRDRKGFGELATELRAVTGGKGSAWEQAAQMGQMLDPGNPLYGGLPQVAANVPRSTAPPLQAVPASGKGGDNAAASSSVDDFGLKLEGLLDEQRRDAGKLPAPMQAAAASAAPDFSLSGVGRGETGGKRIEPTLGTELDQSALTTKLDLAQACQEIGDNEGARELLSEVAAARDPELSRRAQDLLRKMA